jgi:hypothetical protein
MNQEIKERWLEALRSGKFHHCKSVLKRPAYKDNPVRHCVLGVLCELHSRAFPDTDRWDVDNRNIHRPLITYEGLTASLSPSVMEWAGLEDYLPRYVGVRGVEVALSSDNDNSHDYQEAIGAIEVYF